jgi:hypothetical protein
MLGHSGNHGKLLSALLAAVFIGRHRKFLLSGLLHSYFNLSAPNGKWMLSDSPGRITGRHTIINDNQEL